MVLKLQRPVIASEKLPVRVVSIELDHMLGLLDV